MENTQNTNGAAREVRLGDGDETTRVAKFKGYKATRIIREASAISKLYPEIGKTLSEFRREYAENNRITLTRTQAEFDLGPRAAEISEEAWAASDQTISLDKRPSFEEQIAAVLPDVIDKAEIHLIRLLALFVISNEDLRAAWRDQEVDDVLERIGSDLMFDADADQLIELVGAGLEVASDQFAPVRETSGKIAAQLGLEQQMGNDPAIRMAEAETTESTSSETNPDSSTDSPSPTTGTPNESSSTPRTDSSGNSTDG